VDKDAITLGPGVTTAYLAELDQTELEIYRFRGWTISIQLQMPFICEPVDPGACLYSIRPIPVLLLPGIRHLIILPARA
jgi:hypothetical protein